MAPEQALGEVDRLDERTDVFGLGAILCEILTGRPPYVAESGSEVFRLAVRAKLDDAFQRLDSRGADSELIEITKQCLSSEPVDRARDAGVLTSQLSDYFASVPVNMTDAANAIVTERRSCSSSTRAFVSTAACSAAASLVCTTAFSHDDRGHLLFGFSGRSS